jgi:tyrosyl-DNA phosphodiesterase 2
MTTAMYPGKFNSQTGVWNTEIYSSTNLNISELTMVTFNVWFEDYYALERCEALLQIVKECDADIICLQEIKLRYLNYILDQPWVQADYYVSDYIGNTIHPYGVFLLSRLPIACLHFHYLPSVMGRKLLVATFELNHQKMQVATVHLESMPMFAPTRKRQLLQIFPALEQADHTVLMGDLNFCANWPEENNNIDSDYQDMWSVLRNGSPGFTEDTDINVMRMERTQKFKRVRFDRMLVRSSTPGWQPDSIELLGTKPISADCPNVFPSDHFGLVGKLVWRDSNEYSASSV